MNCDNKYILMTRTGDAWQIEEGHTLDDYRKLYGNAYDEGDLWDFSEEEVKAGNSEFKKAKASIGAELKASKKKEVEYFLKEFAPAYDLTLDELE